MPFFRKVVHGHAHKHAHRYTCRRTHHGAPSSSVVLKETAAFAILSTVARGGRFVPSANCPLLELARTAIACANSLAIAVRTNCRCCCQLITTVQQSLETVAAMLNQPLQRLPTGHWTLSAAFLRAVPTCVHARAHTYFRTGVHMCTD